MRKEDVAFLLETLKDAQCDLDYLKSEGHTLFCYNRTRVLLHEAIIIVEAYVNKEQRREHNA